MFKRLVLILALLALPFQVFATDAMFERDKSYELKGWSVYVADDDIDNAAQLITELDTTYAQLAAEDKIEILSSSAADVTQSVTVEGIDNKGDRIKEEIALNTTNGTTAVASTNTFRYIDQVSLDLPCNGTVTIRRATGDTFIVSIPIGIMRAGVAQRFNGEKDSYITGWSASVNSTMGSISYDLRLYPDDAKCLTSGTGYEVIDNIHLTNELGGEYHPLPNVKMPKGGWLAPFATAGTQNSSGSVRIEGFDSL